MDSDDQEDGKASFTVIDTAPASHVYSGGLICNFQDPSSPLSPDYICGELTWDGKTRNLIWFHWNGSTWIRSYICRDICIAVGMDTADLTGNGKADLVAAEWPLGDRKGILDGHVYWFEQPENPFEEEWVPHILASGWSRAHDLVIGDISGAGGPDVLVRLKDGRISWYSKPIDPRTPWSETLIAESLQGDGTALYDVTNSGSLDVVTGSGFYENSVGDGSLWKFHPFQPAMDLQIDHETRVAVGDCAGDGSVTVLISESEVLTNARLVALNSKNAGQSWSSHVLIERDTNLGALHSLQLLDANGNGRLDIFTAEMELYIKDTDIVRRPTWNLLLNKGNLEFDRHIVFDENLGAHMGFAGKISSPMGTDFVAKNWQANEDNAWEAVNHVVHVSGWTP
jgi:hypothetical protein